MGRKYRVTFENVTTAAAQDLIQILGATSKILRILRQWVACTNTTLPTSQLFRIRGRFLPATVTNGSGGTTPTPQKVDVNDAAAAFTAFANNTTPATTNGTAVVLEANGFHAYQGYDNTFANPPIVPAATAWVFELLSTPSGTVAMSGGVEVEEC